MKNYHLYAHGYELVVSEDQNGKWWGFMRKAGNPAQVPAVAGPGELTEVKLAVCREAEALAKGYGLPVMAGCSETLPAWKEISN